MIALNFNASPVVTDLILNCLWQAACMTLITLIAMMATRRMQVAMRKLVLNLVLLGWLMLPVWNGVAVPLNLSIQRLSLQRAQETVARKSLAPESAGLPMPATTIREGAPPMEEATEPASTGYGAAVSGLNGIGVIWLAGIVLGLARLAVDHRALSRVLRGLEPVKDGRTLLLWSRVLAANDCRRSPGLFATGEIETPFSTGWLRPRVVLPKRAIRSWSDAELAAAMCHELAHWRQRDLISCRLQRLAQVVYWWNPAVRFLSRRLSQLQEVICDTIAIHSISSHRDYARLLIKIAEGLRGTALVPAGAVGMARQISSLEQRIQTITSKETTMKSIEMKRRNVVLACSAACCLALPIIGVQITHAAESRDEHREAEPELHLEAEDAGTGVAEIMIRENGVTRRIRIPLDENVRNTRIQDLINQHENQVLDGEIRWIENEDVRPPLVSDEVLVWHEEARRPDAPEEGASSLAREESAGRPSADDHEPSPDSRRSPGNVHVEKETDGRVERRIELHPAPVPPKRPEAVPPPRIEDVEIFVPEAMERRWRREITRSTERAQRSMAGAEAELEARMKVLREQQDAQQQEMQAVMRQQQQQLREAMKTIENNMDALRRENAEIRKQLEKSANPAGDRSSG